MVPLNLDLSFNYNKDKDLIEFIPNYINLSKNKLVNKQFSKIIVSILFKMKNSL